MIRAVVFVWGCLGLLGYRLACAEECVQPDRLVGTDTPYALWGKCLEFQPLSAGSRLPLGSIVYFPVKGGSGSLTISVDRSNLTKELIDDLFEKPDATLLATHHLAQKGMVLALTPTRLRITLYPSVVVSLRSDIRGDSQYRSFSGQPTFVVDEVVGKAFASTDLARISSRFSDVYVQYVMPGVTSWTRQLPDGSVEGLATIPDVLPPRRLPSKASH